MGLTSRVAKSTFKFDHPYGEKDVMPFGQFKGMTVKEVMKENPQYLLWAMDKWDGFDLETEVYDKLIDYLFPEEDEWSGWEDLPDVQE